MRVILVIASVFLICAAVFYSLHNTKGISSTQKTVSYPISTVPTENNLSTSQSVFVPYWTITRQPINSPDTTELLYFGVSPNESGLNTEEQGYKNLDQFVQDAGDHKKQLVLRMTDSDTNFAILKNKNAQSKIASQIVQLAKQDGFSGVILDLEVSSLPFDSVLSQINEFVETLHRTGSATHVPISIALYGDVFYRIRPYDVATLSKNTDGVYILAYDFHKTAGDPGPNFPLSGKDKFGYDFSTMIDAFLKFYPKSKTTVVFGLFGYDWTLDDKNQSSQPAQPVTLSEAKQKFLDGCTYVDCKVSRDSDSGEMRVIYTDSDLNHHEVWLEDMDSVRKKSELLKTKGVTATSLWAYSYF